jgi:AbrB family looped-hinge helix DNA binding protein
MLAKLKDKGQITIPATLREQISAVSGDIFDITITDGKIVLVPQDVVTKLHSNKPKAKGIDITKWIGSAKGAFSSPEDVDAFIRSERDQWE